MTFKFKVLSTPTPPGFPGRGGCFYAKARNVPPVIEDNIGGMVWGEEGDPIHGEGTIRSCFVLKTERPCIWLFGVRLEGAVAIDDFCLTIFEP